MYAKKQNTHNIIPLLLGALVLKTLLACLYKGFLSDTACFYGWAERVFSEGFAGFYSPDVFTDYPPGYMYILYLLGGLIKAFDITYLSEGSLLLLRLPAIICDLAAVYLLFRLSEKHFTVRTCYIISLFYLLNPAVIINSSMWGQVDSVFTLALIVMCLLLTEGKTIPAYFTYVIGVLLKPQMLVFSPLILFAIYEYVFAKGFSPKVFFKNLIGGLLAIACFFLACMPFGITTVIDQYMGTLGSYPYVTVNAYNFWAMLGLNWYPQTDMFLGFSYAQIGTLVIIGLCVIAAVLFKKGINRKDRYFLSGGFIITTMFLFSVRMHERYLFPAMILLLFAYVLNGQKAFFSSYLALSAVHLMNVWHILYYYDPSVYNTKSTFVILVSFMTFVSGLFLYYIIYRSYKGKLPKEREEISLSKLEKPLKPTASEKAMPLLKKDFVIMGLISLFYAGFAFYHLGITKTPTTEHLTSPGAPVSIELPSETPASNICFYLLHELEAEFTVEIKNSPEEEWSYLQDLTMNNVFTWDEVSLYVPASYIRLTPKERECKIGEIVLTDATGTIITPVNKETYPNLFDEEAIFPEEINHLSGCYFDEIYYTRTAYEFMNDMVTYETTHPPFGKDLMCIGVMLFGTSPFGFRFMGTLFGVLMLPFLYLFARNLTKRRDIAAFVSFIFAFDFMHFVQTRLTTIDVFITFFVILMYYFMHKYCTLSFYDTALKKTFLPLGACGIAFGFGIASKWTGFYAGAGLAVIFFLTLWKRYREFCYAKKNPKGNTEGISHKEIVKNFKPYALKTIGFCVIFFVVIPFMIYLLSYIPFKDYSEGGLLTRMLDNQASMFDYHSKLEATHPYSSVWYEWPTMERPIFYYSKEMGEDLRRGISAFGNPLVWWSGIFAFFFMLYLATKKRDKNARFLCIGYLAQYLPWILITRCTFIYHYFPSVPFIALMIGYCFLQLQKKVSKKVFLTLLILFAVICFGLFLLFYPVLSGEVVSREFVINYLKWFENTWTLVV